VTQIVPALELEDVAVRSRRIVDELERAIVGKREALELALAALLADGHVLIEDYPGLAKTLFAKSFAAVTGTRFARVQFTPDLMPSDVTGASIFNQRTGDFEFRPGPVFTNVLLADEINRAPPKTQAALLEAMQEHQVTTDERTRPLERPFLVLATQNPIEYEGTYPLPEAQLDRFLIRMRIGYPSADDEWEILERRVARRSEEVQLEPVVDREELIAMQATIETVHVAPSIGRYIVALVGATRQNPSVHVGASPRGTLALMKLARVKAVQDGREFVVPDDVKAAAVPALAHRLVLRPELWVQSVREEDLVRDCLAQVPVPAAEPDER
jgi:MoxR-like ATPase